MPRSVLAADIDGDGYPDLVIMTLTTLAILISDGDGAFGVAQHFGDNRRPPRSLAVGDFNGDGLPDLAVGYDSGVFVLLNQTPRR